MSNLLAARTGDRRKALEALRDTLASAVDAAEPSVVAQVSAQYRATLESLASLTPAGRRPKRDELAERRKERSEGRVAAADKPARAVRGGKSRDGG